MPFADTMLLSLMPCFIMLCRRFAGHIFWCFAFFDFFPLSRFFAMLLSAIWFRWWFFADAARHADIFMLLCRHAFALIFAFAIFAFLLLMPLYCALLLFRHAPFVILIFALPLAPLPLSPIISFFISRFSPLRWLRYFFRLPASLRCYAVAAISLLITMMFRHWFFACFRFFASLMPPPFAALITFLFISFLSLASLSLIIYLPIAMLRHFHAIFARLMLISPSWFFFIWWPMRFRRFLAAIFAISPCCCRFSLMPRWCAAVFAAYFDFHMIFFLRPSIIFRWYFCALWCCHVFAMPWCRHAFRFRLLSLPLSFSFADVFRFHFLMFWLFLSLTLMPRCWWLLLSLFLLRWFFFRFDFRLRWFSFSRLLMPILYAIFIDYWCFRRLRWCRCFRLLRCFFLLSPFHAAFCHYFCRALLPLSDFCCWYAIIFFLLSLLLSLSLFSDADISLADAISLRHDMIIAAIFDYAISLLSLIFHWLFARWCDIFLDWLRRYFFRCHDYAIFRCWCLFTLSLDFLFADFRLFFADFFARAQPRDFMMLCQLRLRCFIFFATLLSPIFRYAMPRITLLMLHAFRYFDYFRWWFSIDADDLLIFLPFLPLPPDMLPFWFSLCWCFHWCWFSADFRWCWCFIFWWYFRCRFLRAAFIFAITRLFSLPLSLRRCHYAIHVALLITLIILIFSLPMLLMIILLMIFLMPIIFLHALFHDAIFSDFASSAFRFSRHAADIAAAPMPRTLAPICFMMPRCALMLSKMRAYFIFWRGVACAADADAVIFVIFVLCRMPALYCAPCALCCFASFSYDAIHYCRYDFSSISSLFWYAICRFCALFFRWCAYFWCCHQLLPRDAIRHDDCRYAADTPASRYFTLDAHWLFAILPFISSCFWWYFRYAFFFAMLIAALLSPLRRFFHISSMLLAFLSWRFLDAAAAADFSFDVCRAMLSWFHIFRFSPCLCDYLLFSDYWCWCCWWFSFFAFSISRFDDAAFYWCLLHFHYAAFDFFAFRFSCWLLFALLFRFFIFDYFAFWWLPLLLIFFLIFFWFIFQRLLIFADFHFWCHLPFSYCHYAAMPPFRCFWFSPLFADIFLIFCRCFLLLIASLMPPPYFAAADYFWCHDFFAFALYWSFLFSPIFSMISFRLRFFLFSDVELPTFDCRFRAMLTPTTCRFRCCWFIFACCHYADDCRRAPTLLLPYFSLLLMIRCRSFTLARLRFFFLLIFADIFCRFAAYYAIFDAFDFRRYTFFFADIFSHFRFSPLIFRFFFHWYFSAYTPFLSPPFRFDASITLYFHSLFRCLMLIFYAFHAAMIFFAPLMLLCHWWLMPAAFHAALFLLSSLSFAREAFFCWFAFIFSSSLFLSLFSFHFFAAFLDDILRCHCFRFRLFLLMLLSLSIFFDISFRHFLCCHCQRIDAIITRLRRRSIDYYIAYARHNISLMRHVAMLWFRWRCRMLPCRYAMPLRSRQRARRYAVWFIIFSMRCRALIIAPMPHFLLIIRVFVDAMFALIARCLFMPLLFRWAHYYFDYADIISLFIYQYWFLCFLSLRAICCVFAFPPFISCCFLFSHAAAAADWLPPRIFAILPLLITLLICLLTLRWLFCALTLCCHWCAAIWCALADWLPSIIDLPPSRCWFSLFSPIAFFFRLLMLLMITPCCRFWYFLFSSLDASCFLCRFDISLHCFLLLSLHFWCFLLFLLRFRFSLSDFLITPYALRFFPDDCLFSVYAFEGWFCCYYAIFPWLIFLPPPITLFLRFSFAFFHFTMSPMLLPFSISFSSLPAIFALHYYCFSRRDILRLLDAALLDISLTPCLYAPLLMRALYAYAFIFIILSARSPLIICRFPIDIARYFATIWLFSIWDRYHLCSRYAIIFRHTSVIFRHAARCYSLLMNIRLSWFADYSCRARCAMLSPDVRFFRSPLRCAMLLLFVLPDFQRCYYAFAAEFLICMLHWLFSCRAIRHFLRRSLPPFRHADGDYFDAMRHWWYASPRHYFFRYFRWWFAWCRLFDADIAARCRDESRDCTPARERTMPPRVADDAIALFSVYATRWVDYAIFHADFIVAAFATMPIFAAWCRCRCHFRQIAVMITLLIFAIFLAFAAWCCRAFAAAAPLIIRWFDAALFLPFFFDAASLIISFSSFILLYFADTDFNISSLHFSFFFLHCFLPDAAFRHLRFLPLIAAFLHADDCFILPLFFHYLIFSHFDFLFLFASI